jgi:hypothetical protein
MYWLDGESGKPFASKTDMKIPSVVTYPSDFLRKYKNIREKITIHNHPRSYPPSFGDFDSAFRNSYSLGVIACHDGTLFIYNCLNELDNELYNTLSDDYFSMGYSDFTAEKMALVEMDKRGLLVFKEVKPHGKNTGG